MLDQNTDITFHVLKNIVSESPKIEQHIKTASVGQDIRDSLPETAFADRDNRLFPIHTKADAILSKAYATKVANIAPHISSRIENALDMFEVDRSLFKKTQVKIASAPVYDYLLEDQKKLPIRHSGDIKIAEEMLLRNKSKLKPTTMAAASVKLVKHAAAANMNVSDDTMQYAGLTQCDTEKAADWIGARAFAVSNVKIASLYSHLADRVRSIDEHSGSRDELVKVAQVLDKLDSMANISKFYGKSLPDPMHTVFNTKIAMQEMMDLGVKQIPVSKLLEIDPNVYGDILGSDVVPEITDASGEIDPQKMSDVFATLPKDMKEALVQKLGL